MSRGAIISRTRLARAWQRAAGDLGFEFISPYRFTGNDGREYECSGLIRSFGSDLGTLIISRDDRDFERLHDVSDGLGYHGTALNPKHYERYNRQRFVETLRDWTWHGAVELRPLGLMRSPLESP